VDVNGKALTDLPLRERRPRLEDFARRQFAKAERFRLSPATVRLAEAKGWLKKVGATLDGIIAKRRDLPYAAGNRDGMQKIKNYRSADCVVGGFRYNEGKKGRGLAAARAHDDKGLLAMWASRRPSGERQAGAD